MQKLNLKIIKKTSDKVTSLETEALLHIQKRCLPSDDPVKPSGIKKDVWYLVYNKSTVTTKVMVAFALVVPSKNWSDTVYMSRCCVLPEYRGNGLQKRLLKLRDSYARRKGYSWCVTDTRDNPASSNSLIYSGYKIFNPSNPWSYSDSIYWRKKL